jgi:SAM-dependent methyltransferase
VSSAISKLPQLVSTVAVAGPLSVSVGRARCTCFGAGTETWLQPAGGATLAVVPPPPPHPAIRTSESEAAIAVRPALKAQKPTPGACDDRRMRARFLIGRVLNALVARFPVAWPLVRGSMRRFFDRLADGWDQRTSAGSAAHLAPLGAALLHVHPEPERALDIGTGLGDGALLIAREFLHARVRGVDLSGEMIRRAQARIGLDPEGRVAFKVADAAHLPFDDDSFDLVTLLNMPPFFSEIARVLRPGGHAIVAASWGAQTPFYTPDSVLRRGFRKAGLEEAESGEAADGTYFVARRPS